MEIEMLFISDLGFSQKFYVWAIRAFGLWLRTHIIEEKNIIIVIIIIIIWILGEFEAFLSWFIQNFLALAG